MAATVSSVWAKPGAWALDAEEHEDELNREIEAASAAAAKNTYPAPPTADFPSLSVGATTKTKKKTKAQTFSLSDFNNYSTAKPSQTQRERLTHDELMSLPTAPRQRTAEELEQSRGFRNYGSYGGGGDRSSRVSDSGRERVDMGPSRADEADDWSKSKKFTGGSFGGGERRGDNKVGFFGGSSRADDVDNWGSNKSYTSAAPTNNMDGGRRDRRMGFDSFASNGGGGADSETWGRKKDDSFDARRSDRGFDRERKVVGFESSGGAADAETWMKKEREVSNGGGMGTARPRLNLQPRTKSITEVDGSQLGLEVKPKSSNPFGEARPREEVLKEQGKDWKEIDEKLQASKIKEEGGRDGVRRKGFGLGRQGDDSGERSWRKPGTEDAQRVSSENEEAENGDVEKADEEEVVHGEKSENGDDAEGSSN